LRVAVREHVNRGPGGGRMAARFAAGTDALAAVVRERQDLTQRWQRLDAAIAKVVSEPPGRRDATAEAALRQEWLPRRPSSMRSTPK
jgi:hypothetical protein